MGADMRWVITHQPREDRYDYVVVIAGGDLPRDYVLFGFINGIRCQTKPIFDPRGFHDTEARDELEQAGYATRPTWMTHTDLALLSGEYLRSSLTRNDRYDTLLAILAFMREIGQRTWVSFASDQD